MRKYELYCNQPRGKVKHFSRDYKTGMFIFEVRASSIKQAYYMCGNLIPSSGPGMPGITHIDCSHWENFNKYTWPENIQSLLACNK
jgi:hypothetical protein